jgi:uncharacterized membrane protein YkoI
MLKKLLIGGGIAGVLTTGIIIGSLTLAPALAQSGNNATDQGQATISAADAEAIALAANPGTSVDENDLEKENSVLVYSIELSNGTDVAVDANTGEILQTRVDDEDNKKESEDQDSAENESGADVEEQNEVDEQLPLGDAKITPEQAKSAALSQYPEANIIKVELENENGSLVYGVALTVNGKVYDVKVDANNGNVVRTEADEPEGQSNDFNEQEAIED